MRLLFIEMCDSTFYKLVKRRFEKNVTMQSSLLGKERRQIALTFAV